MAHCPDKSQTIPINHQQDVRQFDYRKKHTSHHSNASKKINLNNKRKSKESYSVANVFATSTKPTRRQRKREHKRDNRNTTIINVLNDQMGEVGGKIAKDATETFDEVLESHLENLMSIEEKDERFKSIISEAILKLAAPLISRNGDLKSLSYLSDSPTSSDANIITKDNSNIDTVYNIKKYKQIINMEQENLRNCWKQWEDIHDEYLALGIEVFGPESFDDNTAIQRNGFKSDMELLDLQHKSKIMELEGEIEKLGSNVMQKMKKSEKSVAFDLHNKGNFTFAKGCSYEKFKITPIYRLTYAIQTSWSLKNNSGLLVLPSLRMIKVPHPTSR
ncbi:hypothetical protein OnM2_061048 [Erysiphe neolycopersici]|uniref:Uncharacterized protein n=1 Tax=Erysiphe neolycopersici TaxID=212602 RepID=A0A420HP69_9PEZI|nr:hypothetical protein OnM2_061048 [Erysiphe neolycopersici]